MGDEVGVGRERETEIERLLNILNWKDKQLKLKETDKGWKKNEWQNGRRNNINVITNVPNNIVVKIDKRKYILTNVSLCI